MMRELLRRKTEPEDAVGFKLDYLVSKQAFLDYGSSLMVGYNYGIIELISLE